MDWMCVREATKRLVGLTITPLKRKALVCLLLMVGMTLPVQARSNSQVIEESQLRAAVIVGILRYTQWEIPMGNVIHLCVVGESSTIGHLQKVTSQPIIRDKSINIVELKDFKSVAQCEVIIAGSNDQILLDNQDLIKNTLVICDNCDVSAEYSAVEIKKYKERIVFAVNLTRAKQNKLRFRSALLELAVKVEGMYE